MTCKQATKQASNQPRAEELDYRGAAAPKTINFREKWLK